MWEGITGHIRGQAGPPSDGVLPGDCQINPVSWNGKEGSNSAGRLLRTWNANFRRSTTRSTRNFWWTGNGQWRGWRRRTSSAFLNLHSLSFIHCRRVTNLKIKTNDSPLSEPLIRPMLGILLPQFGKPVSTSRTVADAGVLPVVSLGCLPAAVGTDLHSISYSHPQFTVGQPPPAVNAGNLASNHRGVTHRWTIFLLIHAFHLIVATLCTSVLHIVERLTDTPHSAFSS